MNTIPWHELNRCDYCEKSIVEVGAGDIYYNGETKVKRSICQECKEILIAKRVFKEFIFKHNQQKIDLPTET